MADNYPCCCGGTCCFWENGSTCSPKKVELTFSGVQAGFGTCCDCDQYNNLTFILCSVGDGSLCLWRGDICPKITEGSSLGQTFYYYRNIPGIKCNEYFAELTVTNPATDEYVLTLNIRKLLFDQVTHKLHFSFKLEESGSTYLDLDTEYDLTFDELLDEDNDCDFRNATATVKFLDSSECSPYDCQIGSADIWCPPCQDQCGTALSMKLTVPSDWTQSGECPLGDCSPLEGEFILDYQYFSGICIWDYKSTTEVYFKCNVPPFGGTYLSVFHYSLFLYDLGIEYYWKLTLLAVGGLLRWDWYTPFDSYPPTPVDCNNINTTLQYTGNTLFNPECDWGGSDVQIETV